MILYLEGHDYRYAVEQCQLVFFPEDRPVFADAKPSPEAGAALSRLTYARRYACASTVIYHDKSVCRGHAYVDLARYAEGRARERALTWAVKLSFYRAAVRATGTRPPWGALTGIRPAGMLRTLMRDGMTLTQADGVLRSRFDVSPEKRALCRAAAASSLSAEGRLGRDDIGLYVGIPFCPSRCAYCTFVSHAVSKAGHLLPDFLEALAREIEMVGVLVKDLRLRPAALYIGGGTPTVLSAGQLETLAAKLSACFDLSSLREYTVEAGRPDTITREKLSALRRAGVTRISVNPQSLRDDVLRAAGRPHTANDALRAYEMSVDAGFSVNTDLIAGLPVAEHPVTEHTIAGRPIDGFDIDGRPSRAATEAFRESLDGILALRPDNITIHTLARKKGSAITLGQVPLPLPAPDDVGNMLSYAYGNLPPKGYRCYYLYRQKFMAGPFENTGWTLPGRENLYNILMMEDLRSVLAMGGGGVTKLVDTGNRRVRRIFNPKYPYEYLSRFHDIEGKKEEIRKFR